MNISMVKESGLRAIRKRTRGSVTQEHIKYNAKIITRIGSLINAQYRRVKNQGKWDRVMQYIGPMIYESGEVLACKVEMTVNPEMLTAMILYRGESFYMINEEIRELILPADSLTVVEKNGEFWLALRYSLCDEEQIADYSERIQALRFCLEASGGPKVNMSEIQRTPRIDAEPEMM